MPPLRLVALACLCSGLSGCWVAPPRPDEWMMVGFRTPKQAIATFQIAIRADEPELEYRCFSQEFRARNRISKLAWREARAELRRRHPWLRKGIADAEIHALDLAGNRARVLLETHGEWVRIDCVREDYAELWSGDALISDEFVAFDERTSIETGADGRRWLHGLALLPAGDSSSAPATEMHLGREWKIDSFESADPPRGPARTCAETPAREAQTD